MFVNDLPPGDAWGRPSVRGWSALCARHAARLARLRGGATRPEPSSVPHHRWARACSSGCAPTAGGTVLPPPPLPSVHTPALRRACGVDRAQVAGIMCCATQLTGCGEEERRWWWGGGGVAGFLGPSPPPPPLLMRLIVRCVRCVLGVAADAARGRSAGWGMGHVMALASCCRCCRIAAYRAGASKWGGTWEMHGHAVVVGGRRGAVAASVTVRSVAAVVGAHAPFTAVGCGGRLAWALTGRWATGPASKRRGAGCWTAPTAKQQRFWPAARLRGRCPGVG
jgi:hypothetical protein